jgi:hypothetical protein
MHKRTIILILSLLTIVLLLLWYFLQSTPTKVPLAPFPTPTIFKKPVQPVPPELLNEKMLQENYATKRQDILIDKPWLLKLPLQSSNFFLTYDSEKNEFLVTLYYSLAQGLPPKEQQIAQAKQDATDAGTKVGIFLIQEKVVYFEIRK